VRFLAVSLATWLVLAVVGARGLAWYARRHHLPEQRMTRALDAGDGCLVVLGDSRMDAATDAAALRERLRAAGHDRCVAELALGAVDVGGITLTARRYLAEGGKPWAFVVGMAGDSLVSGLEPVPADQMIGNNAIHLTWSRPADVLSDVPGFPLADIGAFDAGFRFLLARATALGQYQSLISAKTQALGFALTGAEPARRNRFGALGDMTGLEAGLRARAPLHLAAAMGAPTAQRLGPWFAQLLSLLREHGTRFWVVELPMRSSYRASVTETPLCRSYQGWLADELPRWGGKLIDLSREAWVEDGLFADELHLGPEGAARVSSEIGRRIGADAGP
jgi:hypothetical protein